MNRAKISWISIEVVLLVFAGSIYLLTGCEKSSERSLAQPTSDNGQAPLQPSNPDKMTALQNYPPADSEEQFSLLYLALRGTEPDEKELRRIASLISEEYRQETQRSKRQDLLEQLKPGMQISMEAFKRRYFVVSKQVFFGHYNAGAQSFPLNQSTLSPASWSIDKTAYFDRGGIRLKATNQAAFSSYVVKDKAVARNLESIPDLQRQSTAQAYMYAQQIENDGPDPIIRAEIVRIRILDKTGQLIADMPN